MVILHGVVCCGFQIESDLQCESHSNCVLLLRFQERPYYDDSTASRLLSEVEHRRGRLVLRWGDHVGIPGIVIFVLCFLFPKGLAIAFDSATCRIGLWDTDQLSSLLRSRNQLAEEFPAKNICWH